VVLVDGVWIGSWCLLIALSSTNHVLGWQWAARESTAAWEALFTQIPEPMIVVTDGGSGIRSALARTWPTAKIQRCIFHLQMNVTRELTRSPRTEAGRRLRNLAGALSDVHTTDDAIAWRLTLEAWWQRHGHLTRERTMFRNGSWGYTHDKLRKAWGILHRTAQTGHVFTYLDHTNPRTTSRLEGLNSQIRHLLRNHRGMPLEHRKRAVEWFLLLHEIPLTHAHRHAHAPTPQAPASTNDNTNTTPLYDTGLDPSEGLWTRTGWAGRG
jgi:transposase-like protein